MQLHRFPLFAAAVLGVALAAPALAQDTTAPLEIAPPAAPEAAPAPSVEPLPLDAPSADAPAEIPPAETPPALTAPVLTPPAEAPSTAEPGGPTAAGPDDAQAEAAPAQPEITVTAHGEWEVGCLAGTTNCEMQQLASDPDGNPVILVRIVRLPAGSEALALAVFNTPLGTLLPAGLGFQVDAGQNAALPFEWCVQEGCIVRLGLREPDVAAMKRGRTVTLSVASITEPDTALELDLSLAGFTAAYDMLTEPTAPAQ